MALNEYQIQNAEHETETNSKRVKVVGSKVSEIYVGGATVDPGQNSEVIPRQSALGASLIRLHISGASNIADVDVRHFKPDGTNFAYIRIANNDLLGAGNNRLAEGKIYTDMFSISIKNNDSISQTFDITAVLYA